MAVVTCEKCGQSSTTFPDMCFGQCSNPACNSRIVLGRLPNGKKYVRCDAHICIVDEDEVVYHCSCGVRIITGQFYRIQDGQNVFYSIALASDYERFYNDYILKRGQLKTEQTKNIWFKNYATLLGSNLALERSRNDTHKKLCARVDNSEIRSSEVTSTEKEAIENLQKKFDVERKNMEIKLNQLKEENEQLQQSVQLKDKHIDSLCTSIEVLVSRNHNTLHSLAPPPAARDVPTSHSMTGASRKRPIYEESSSNEHHSKKK